VWRELTVSCNLACCAIFWLATAPVWFLPGELGQEAGKAVGTFAPLVARYGLKNVPTQVEIIAELPACHAGALTNLWVCAKPRQAKAPRTER
jgi:hypothetical protein